MRNSQAGFTLIELLAVVAMIGLLATIVIGAVSSGVVKSRDARRLADLKSLQNALAGYNNDNGKYPTAISKALLVPTYISVIPSDPQSTGVNLCTTGVQTGCYKYAALSAACNNYHLGATLENPNNAALNNAPHDAASASICAGLINNTGNADFNGASPVYDVSP
jgi:prepilin-type N-terminal cleavage/methylation domain-containing protein